MHDGRTVIIFVVLLSFLISIMLRSINCFPVRTSSLVKFIRKTPISCRQLSALNNAKPDFRKEFDSKYFEFQKVESDIYKWWESSGYFKPKPNDNKEKFVITMPPPNVTGYLHMGHAIFIALQDIMTRFHRMKGVETLWLPGTDHAGIATQMLVEKALAAEGISRTDLGREAFLSRVWQWKEEKGGYITQQMKRLGASADWSKEKFTLDPDMCEAVTEAFIQLYNKGLIYRGSYMVNWSPKLMTAVSDLEVEYVEEEGTLYYFKYPLANSDCHEYIPVATTRPETILGDSAVCVHPNDSRYAKFIGQYVKVPLLDRLIPIIADEYVDPTFGTGALKVTPAHDVNDYALGKKHHLPMINIMHKNGTINELGGSAFQGLDRFECRKQLWIQMQNIGLVLKEEKHTQRIPRSQRSGEIIEPLISNQWFVKMDSMANKAIQKVQSKELTIIPERFEKIWYHWLENIHDWCISRQLWWGHRIPVYYLIDESTNERQENEFVVATSLSAAQKIAREKYGKEVTLQQDEDVLDTWFSSGLWPFATVGWPHALQSPTNHPDKANEFARYYPGHVMETGYDILFFWVARMVTMGLELTNQLPFHTIYLHGLIRDAQGQKMSKTKGNVIDPIDTINIFGSDALRYTLVTSSTPGQDVSLAMEKIEYNRNFVNKLWNIGKYIEHCRTSSSSSALQEGVTSSSATTNNLIAWDTLYLSEKYILSKHHELIVLVNEHLNQHQFAEAGKLISDFLWNELADWYIEISKTHIQKSCKENQRARTLAILFYLWDHSLRLLHPYMPYITEMLYQQLPSPEYESIMLAPFPQQPTTTTPNNQVNAKLLTTTSGELMVDNQAMKVFGKFQEIVKQVRNLRAEYNVEVNKKLPVVIRLSTASNSSSTSSTASSSIVSILQEKAALALLCKLDEQNITVLLSANQQEQEAPEQVVPDVIYLTETQFSNVNSNPDQQQQYIHLIIDEEIELLIPQSELIDKEKEFQRLKKQLEKLQKDIDSLEKRLSNDNFRLKAPEVLVKETQDKLQDMMQQKTTIEQSIEKLK